MQAINSKMNAERKWKNRVDPVLALLVITCIPLLEMLIGSGDNVKASHCNVKTFHIR